MRKKTGGITMTKHCPFMMISKILAEVTGTSGIRGCTVTIDTRCGEESCAIWNETQSRCGLVCTSQPEQPSKQPLSVNQIQLARMMPVMLVNLKTGDNQIGFLEGVAEEGTGINECREIAKFWWYCMDFANEYRMEEYGKTWVMYPYYPVSPIGI